MTLRGKLHLSAALVNATCAVWAASVGEPEWCFFNLVLLLLNVSIVKDGRVGV